MWQDWVDMIMEYMRGLEERIDAESNNNRTIVWADLRESVVELCLPRANNEGAVEKTGTARIWNGVVTVRCKHVQIRSGAVAGRTRYQFKRMFRFF